MKIKMEKNQIIICSTICLLIFCWFIHNNNLFVINDYFNITYLILAIILSFITCFIFSSKIEFDRKTKQVFIITLCTLSVLFPCFITELLNRNNLFSIELKRLIFNIIIVFVFNLIVFCISNRLKFTLIFSNIIIFLLGLTNYIIVSFRSTPFIPGDILCIKTAAGVALTYEFQFSYYLIFAIICCVLFISIASKVDYTFRKCKKNTLVRLSILVFVLILTFVFYITNLINIFNLDTNLWNPNEECINNGFLASFIKQSRNLINNEPDEYCLEKVQKIYKSIESNNKINYLDYSALPNIIVIMNESFSDLSVNGKFNTNRDYMPYFRKLCNSNNTISGNIYTSVFGGQTPNSEWEFLTNNSMAFIPYRSIPYQQYIFSKSFSLANTLKSQGYYTYAIHPWYPSGYRRNTIYPLLGFDEFLSINNLQNLNYLRKYPDDESTYNNIIKLFKEKESNKKIFNFTVTMQNHSGYDLEGIDSEIFLTNYDNFPRVEQYLTLIKKSDSALKHLINYFSTYDEDTIILMFGDHQPPYLEEDFWENILDKTNDLETSKYITPFVLWANFDIPEQTIDKISLNYLSIILCDTANLKTTKYMDFLRNMQKEIPVITGNGYMDSKGSLYKFTDINTFTNSIRDYEMLQYNNMFDIKNRINSIFSINEFPSV